MFALNYSQIVPFVKVVWHTLPSKMNLLLLTILILGRSITSSHATSFTFLESHFSTLGCTVPWLIALLRSTIGIVIRLFCAGLVHSCLVLICGGGGYLFKPAFLAWWVFVLMSQQWLLLLTNYRDTGFWGSLITLLVDLLVLDSA